MWPMVFEFVWLTCFTCLFNQGYFIELLALLPAITHTSRMAHTTVTAHNGATLNTHTRTHPNTPWIAYFWLVLGG